MNPRWEKWGDVVKRLSGGGGWLGQLGLAFMVISIFYDVTRRYVFIAPTFWALEVNTFLLVFLCTIPAADVLQIGSQIRITFLIDRLMPKHRARLEILRCLAGLFFCAVMTWKGTGMAWQAWEHNDRMSTSLGTPLVIPYLFLPIGFFLLALQYAAMLRIGGSQSPIPPVGEAQSRKPGEVEQQI